MKNLKIKHFTSLFVCMCIMSAVLIEAKCCGQNKPSVIERVKQKISKIINKNNEESQENLDDEAIKEEMKTVECSTVDEQCSSDEECEDVKNLIAVVSPVVTDVTETATENIATLSATDVLEAITTIIEEEIEATTNQNVDDVVAHVVP